MYQLNRSSKDPHRHSPNLAKSPVTGGKLALRNTLYLLFLNPPDKHKHAWRTTDCLIIGQLKNAGKSTIQGKI